MSERWALPRRRARGRAGRGRRGRGSRAAPAWPPQQPSRTCALASVTALGRLGHRHEWAIDGLIEALADGSDSPVRVAAALDELAPRPGSRLLPLLAASERRRPLLRGPAPRPVPRAAPCATCPTRRGTLPPDPCGGARDPAGDDLRRGAPLRARAARRSAPARPRARGPDRRCRRRGRAARAGRARARGRVVVGSRRRPRDAHRRRGQTSPTSMLAALEDENVDVRRGAALVLQDLGVGEPPWRRERDRP